jgi:predicted DNA-binding WGR domain protein
MVKELTMPKKATKKTTKKATANQATVFVLVETWSRDCDSEGSPTVTVFSNVEAARKRLLELVKEDNKTGITETVGEEGEDWEINQTPDWYSAWNEGSNSWVDFTIFEETVHDK